MQTLSPVDEARMLADRAGVEVRRILSPADCRTGGAVLADVWRTPNESPPLTPETLRALSHVGAYVYGVWDRTDGLVGVSVGFLTGGPTIALHSHVTGVLSSHRRRGLGLVLKQHQRAWALAQGIDTIGWTCDPLVRRNMMFNLARLGAAVQDYVPDFYGAMTDGVNAGDSSDRAELTWTLRTPRSGLTEAADAVPAIRLDRGAPVPVDPGTARRVLVATPEDIEALRSTDRAAAKAWRLAVREALVSRLAAGWQVRGITAGGDYVVEAP
ncbi:MAG TPA: GNAT family N-acetyltransferase [Mycobacteriales bacterium]|nr:GNAT family N-acetyltransferase [Mycobacteriales bacterium]